MLETTCEKENTSKKDWGKALKSNSSMEGRKEGRKEGKEGGRKGGKERREG
jgi:hypothetical protein